MVITGYHKCQCGAITFFTDSGETYSVLQKNRKEFFPDVDLRKIERFQETFSCNHCVNHYGVDLCGCGSGEPFGECEEGFDECKIPMQVVGHYTQVVGKDVWGRWKL